VAELVDFLGDWSNLKIVLGGGTYTMETWMGRKKASKLTLLFWTYNACKYLYRGRMVDGWVKEDVVNEYSCTGLRFVFYKCLLPSKYIT